MSDNRTLDLYNELLEVAKKKSSCIGDELKDQLYELAETVIDTEEPTEADTELLTEAVGTDAVDPAQALLKEADSIEKEMISTFDHMIAFGLRYEMFRGHRARLLSPDRMTALEDLMQAQLKRLDDIEKASQEDLSSSADTR